VSRVRAALAVVIVLIRHGQTTTNAANLLVGRSDPALTELGERQARALAPLLVDVVEVWSSPLRRARTTAALAMPHVEVRVVDAFIEVDYGHLDGQPLSVVTLDEWHRFETDHTSALGDGESLASVDQRVHAVLDELFADRESLLHDPDRHLAIVSHVSPIKSAMAWALGVPGSVAWRTRLDNGSLTTLATRRHTPSLIHFNVVPPLAD
jgi:broad specificity phosphatase PhoE